MLVLVLQLLVISTTILADDIVCPSTGQHFYPHPIYCAMFIECKNGNKQEHTCFPGTIYNADKNYCDFPSNYYCEDKPVIVPGPVGSCPPINGEFVDFLTHSMDCSIFYMCNWGIALQMHCPNGLHFNANLNVCDWPCYAGCTLEQQVYVTS